MYKGFVYKIMLFKFLKLFIPFVFYNGLSVFGQVYHYFPLTYNNIENNPSAIKANAAYRLNIEYLSSLNINKPLIANQTSGIAVTKKPLGLGAVLGGAVLNDRITYRYLGIAAGYKINYNSNKNILMGLTYKFLEINTQNASFDYYQTDITGRNLSNQHNLNFAVTFTDTLNKFYLSANVLNVLVPFVNDNSTPKFPLYYVLHAGNLAKILNNSKESDISIMLMSRLSPINNKYWHGYYVNLSNQYKITNSFGMHIGSRIGFADNNYWHFIPYVSLIKNHKYAFKFSYSTHKNKVNFEPLFASNFQIGFAMIQLR